VQWIGVKKGDGKGIVAVVERWRWFDVTSDGMGQLGYPDLPPADRLKSAVLGHRRKIGRQEWMPESVVFDLSSGKSCPVGGRGMAIFLDSKNRLWFGYERGEFGGWCRCVDVSGAEPKLIRGSFDPDNGEIPLWDCIHGFVETKDGRVLALGGLEGVTIYRLDVAKIETLIDLSGNDFERAFGLDPKPADPNEPNGPLVWMLEEARPGSFLALSEGETLQRSDKDFKRWEKVRDLGDDIRFRETLTEFGDFEPPVRTVHDRGGKLLVATASDGYVRIDEEGVKKDLILNQLEANKIDQIDLTPVGPLFWERGVETPWQIRDGSWTHEPLRLPIEGVLDDPEMFLGPDGSIYVITSKQIRRWHEGKVETVTNDVVSIPGSLFALPDGTLWAVRPGIEVMQPDLILVPRIGLNEPKYEPGSLSRLVGEKWEKAADLPGLIAPQSMVTEYLDQGEMMAGSEPEVRKTRKGNGDGYPFPPNPRNPDTIGGNLHVINSVGPHWVVHDRDTQQLFSFDLARAAPGFVLLRVEEAGLPLKVYDAIGWSREEVLIATRKGLKLCEVATGKIRPAPLPAPDRPVKRLARDGLKRLWLGGEGLWMVDAENRLHDLAEVPMVGRSEVSALAIDPKRRDGVIVALGSRGVAFLQVEPGSR
jgi:hypothetical protein